MTGADKALLRLLRRGESARSRTTDEQVFLAMTTASCPEYGDLATLDALESFHAAISAAERAGAITAERQKTGGDGAGLKRIKLTNLDALAAHMGVCLLSHHAGVASHLLSPWQTTYPVIERMLQTWTHGRKIRGQGPQAAADVLAAIDAVESRKRDPLAERILRRESVRLYGDSKRLERLTPWLDVLVTGELKASGLRDEDIWGALGLRREPQPMLIAGRGNVTLRDGVVPLVKPYLGLPVDAVQSIDTAVRYLLTIENLASFHDAARTMPDTGGLLIYTAGMPSPAWRALYARILHGLPRDAAIYHWGDIDEGGFRIATVLSSLVTECGRILRPWLMSPRTISVSAESTAQPSAAAFAQMQLWARRAGWSDVADDLARQPIQIEQELLDPLLPNST